MSSLSLSKQEVLATNPAEVLNRGMSEFELELYTTNGGYVVEPYHAYDPAMAYVGSNSAEITAMHTREHEGSLGFLAVSYK